MHVYIYVCLPYMCIDRYNACCFVANGAFYARLKLQNCRELCHCKVSLTDHATSLFVFPGPDHVHVQRLVCMYAGNLVHHIHGMNAVKIMYNISYACMQGISCITYMIPFKDKLIYSSLLIPCFFVVLMLAPIFAYLVHGRQGSDKGLQTYRKTVNCFYFCVLFITFTAYPAVSRNILSTFACVNLGADGNYLRADMRTVCPVAGEFALVWAGIFTAFIPFGIPAILLLVLVAHGVPQIVSQKQSRSLLQGLFQTFAKELDAAAINDLFKTIASADQAGDSEAGTRLDPMEP
jgi:hypothetical protein